MFELLFSNPLLIVATVLVFILILLVVFISPRKKKKNAKVEKVYPSKKEEQTNQVDTSTATESVEINEPSEDIVLKESEDDGTDDLFEDENKSKLAKRDKKLKPHVEQVFKREESKLDIQAPGEIEPDIDENELLEKMQFVKSSKKVSKLVSLGENDNQVEIDTEDVDNIEQTPEVVTSRINSVKTNADGNRYFDKTRRISRCIECGSVDEIFCPHLSDRYLNINVDKHLKDDENIFNSLYSRTSKMLANSGAKFSVDGDEDSNFETPLKDYKNDKDYMKDWLERRKREELAKFIIDDPNADDDIDVSVDDVNLSARSILITDSIINRKRLKRKV